MNLGELSRRYNAGSKVHEQALINRAENGQSPASFWMACMDSGNSPNTLLQYVPGDVLVERTPGGFIPPYAPDSELCAMIDLAFTIGVEAGTISYNVLPHTQCGAAKALSDGKPPTNIYLARAYDAVKDALEIQRINDPDALAKEIERQFAISSLRNMREYPALKSGVKGGAFETNAFLHNIAKRELHRVNPNTWTLEKL